MGALSRYYKIREYGPSGLGKPYMLDRKKMTVEPYHCDEWWKHPKTGLWCPVLRGGNSFIFSQTPGLVFGATGSTGIGAQQTTTLNNAYTFGSLGSGMAARASVRLDDTMTAIRFFVTAIAADSTVHWELRSGGATSPSTLIATGSQVITSASGAGWKTISLSQAVSAGFLWIILRGESGNNITVLHSHSAATLSSNQDAYSYMGATSADGFNTTSLVARRSTIVTTYSSGINRGSPFSDAVGSTSSTNRRGLYLTGLSAPLIVLGVAADVGSSQISGCELIEDNTTPGGAVKAAGTVLMSATTSVNGALFSTPQTLARKTPYRLVLTYSSASTIPRKLVIGTGADDVLRGMTLGGANMYWAEANDVTDWANDDINAWPGATIFIDDLAPIGRLTLLN